MKFLFVMDPIESVNIDADTTFALMLAAQEGGHELFMARHTDLRARMDEAWGTHRALTLRRTKGDHFEYTSEPVTSHLTDFDAIFMRTDPPFDIPYLHAVHILGLARDEGVLVVNDPLGLRVANEKLYALHFPTLIPKTWITSDKREILQFLDEEGGEAILKPVDGHGGDGVVVLRREDSNLNALIELTTQNGTARGVVQALIPEAKEGDKRILLLDGEPLGAILRVPQNGEHRGNIHVGGAVQPASLTARDIEICDQLRSRLQADGLYFVGIDILGESLTEVNVTSPTGIQEMMRFDDIDYAAKVIEWTVSHVERMW